MSTGMTTPDPLRRIVEARTCDARLGWAERPEGWGRTPIYCRQRVGLTSFRDVAGRTRRHCSRAGHRAAAVRRYGEWQPEQADPLTQGKALEDWVESEKREAYGR